MAKIHLFETDYVTRCRRRRDQLLAQSEKREIWVNGMHRLTVSHDVTEVTCVKCNG